MNTREQIEQFQADPGRQLFFTAMERLVSIAPVKILTSQSDCEITLLPPYNEMLEQIKTDLRKYEFDNFPEIAKQIYT